MEKTKEVLESQLDLAEYKDRIVEKVILTGGFGQSPSLQGYLREYLAERAKLKGRRIDLVVPKNPLVVASQFHFHTTEHTDDPLDRPLWPGAQCSER